MIFYASVTHAHTIRGQHTNNTRDHMGAII